MYYQRKSSLSVKKLKLCDDDTCKRRCRLFWYLSLALAIVCCNAQTDTSGVVAGVTKDSSQAPYRRVSRQCNPQEDVCSEVDPKAGIADIYAEQIGQVVVSNSTLEERVVANSSDLPPKELLGLRQLSPQSELTPSAEDDNQSPTEEPFNNPLLSGSNLEQPVRDQQLALTPTLAPTPAPATASSSSSAVPQNNNTQSQSPELLPVSGVAPQVSPSPPSEDADEQQQIDAPGFNPTQQQSISKLSDESPCLKGLNGCTCKEEWSWNGIIVQGCGNPDDDAKGPWCQIVPKSCETAAGVLQNIEDTTTNFYDYCKPECVVEDEEQETEEPQPAASLQNQDGCVEIVNECPNNQFYVAFADGDYLPSITFRDHSYRLVQGWWTLNGTMTRYRWCSPSNQVAVFVQAYEQDLDRTSDAIWENQFISSQMYCVPNDGQVFSLLQFQSTSDPDVGFLSVDGTNYTSCEEYQGTLKRFFVYQAPLTLTISDTFSEFCS
eukprot:TRINITY_DN25619_c0_g2_i1.p1 TRINITY_DN25619_c0_g2~~TRINITY_DN25619_c0_g2_i1.p1  ORF type:complete len:492 (-),score=49.17 TRINITY_DN25619_c0_g2_i1:1531-3006(-)